MKIMNARFPILTVLLPFFMACSKPTKETTDATNWVILAPAGSPASGWSLDEGMVPDLLDGARTNLKQKLEHPANELERDNLTEILSKWDGYSCQIFPVIRSQNGARVVTMSFFPTRQTASTFKDWRKSPVMVDGGGSGYWTLSYDPEKKEYSDFGVNALE